MSVLLNTWSFGGVATEADWRSLVSDLAHLAGYRTTTKWGGLSEEFFMPYLERGSYDAYDPWEKRGEIMDTELDPLAYIWIHDWDAGGFRKNMVPVILERLLAIDEGLPTAIKLNEYASPYSDLLKFIQVFKMATERETWVEVEFEPQNFESI